VDPKGLIIMSVLGVTGAHLKDIKEIIQKSLDKSYPNVCFLLTDKEITTLTKGDVSKLIKILQDYNNSAGEIYSPSGRREEDDRKD